VTPLALVDQQEKKGAAIHAEREKQKEKECLGGKSRSFHQMIRRRGRVSDEDYSGKTTRWEKGKGERISTRNKKKQGREGSPYLGPQWTLNETGNAKQSGEERRQTAC